MHNSTYLLLSAAPNVGKAERGASIISGSLLVFTGLRNRSWTGLGLAAAGAALIGRGVTGRCAAYRTVGVRTTGRADRGHVSVPYGEGIRIDKTVTVNKPRFEVYSYWRNLENLPNFMQHVEKIRTTGETLSQWVARSPFGKSVEWGAEIINDIPGELIGWRSLPGGDVENAGSVHFRDAAGDRGTEVKVSMQYLPPGGQLGALAVKMFGENPEKQVEEDLRRFKMMMETGEITTTPHTGNQASETKQKKESKEAEVQKASEESFPASDAPAWT